jgi:hypothetical protein
MKRVARSFAIIAVATAGLVPAGAHAQWYSSYPRQASAYPYDGQQPYAVEVAPGTYVIHRPTTERRQPERAAPEKARTQIRNDPALIEELRERSHARRTVVHSKKIVREKPVVVVHKRVVDDPPRVIVREHVVDDLPRGRGLFQPPPRQVVQDLPPVVEQAPPESLPPSWHQETRHAGKHKFRHAEPRKAARHIERREAIVRGEPDDKRTIRAEAEVTILGPDRMMIRLFRKGSAAKAEADVN